MAKSKTPKDASTAKTAAEIAQAAMPGWTAVPPAEQEQSVSALDAGSPADDALPSLAELRRKYLGETADAVDALEEAPAEDDTEIVTMVSGTLTKTVGVAGGKVKWSQG